MNLPKPFSGPAAVSLPSAGALDAPRHNDSDYSVALAEAKALGGPGYWDRARTIDEKVGRFVWRNGRHVMVWPNAICDAAGAAGDDRRRQPGDE